MRSILSKLGDSPALGLTLDPSVWPVNAKVLLWEAFVSGPGHARSPNALGVSQHVQDAATGAAYRWSDALAAPICVPRTSRYRTRAVWA